MQQKAKPPTEPLTGLALLRSDFPENQVSKLPKGTRAQNECPANEKKSCSVCGGWHHPKIRHLDYVGHAAVTDRLLDCDINWTWEPLSFDEKGLPRYDESGGMWIRLTVCGQTRLGYGNAKYSANKDVGSREKEVIGDAIRNAAMRFGAALELWHKGDLHLPLESSPEEDEPTLKIPKPLVSITMEEAKAREELQSSNEPPFDDPGGGESLAQGGSAPIVPGAIKIVLIKLKIAGKALVDLEAKFGVKRVEDLKQSQVNAVLDFLKV